MSAVMIACVLALIIDAIIGDPPTWPHPIKYIGKYIQLCVKKLNKGHGRKWKGVLLFFIVVSTTVLIVGTLVWLAYSIHFVLGLAIETLLIAVGVAQKSLKDAAMLVYIPLVQGDMVEAREKLSWIVGRDTAHLDESEITRGVVETVSENTSDGVTAPLFWAFLFGATGLWAYKAVNTLDSMIGYKNEIYGDIGMFSARMDDVLNYIPSRISGFLLLLFTKNETARPFKERFKRWKQDAKKHPSPNSGWLEAATAYQLGIQLGGENRYKGIVSYRALMGEKQISLRADHILKTITQMRVTVVIFTILMLIVRGIINGLT